MTFLGDLTSAQTDEHRSAPRESKAVRGLLLRGRGWVAAIVALLCLGATGCAAEESADPVGQQAHALRIAGKVQETSRTRTRVSAKPTKPTKPKPTKPKPTRPTVVVVGTLNPAPTTPTSPPSELKRWTGQYASPTTESNTADSYWDRQVAIGIAPQGFDCAQPPAGSTWRYEPLFDGKSVSKRPQTPDGGKFCRYTHAGGAGFSWDGLPAYAVRCGEGNIICSAQIKSDVWLKPDARVAVSQAPEGALSEMQAALQTGYLREMGAVRHGAPIATENAIDLIIIDTLGDSRLHDVAPLAGADHGRALAVAAFMSACPAGPGAKCPISIRQYRGYQPGTVLSLTEMAEALVRAVDDSVARGRRMVINFSQGVAPKYAWWDEPGTNEDEPSGVMLPAFELLKAAINYAGQQGAITVAAIGNTDGAHQSDADRAGEFMYPAAFDGVTGWSCDDTRHCSEDAARPLVIAAGGVTADNQTLPNARITHVDPDWLAPACNVALLNHQVPGEYDVNATALPTYCGTSFGAIGVSATLAATWAHLPGRPWSDALEAMRAGGLDLDAERDGCTPGHRCRVRLCQSMLAAGANVICETPLQAGVLAPAALSTFISTHTLDVDWYTSDDSAATTDFACSEDIVYTSDEARNAHSCPAEDYRSRLADLRRADSLPGDPVCESCGVVVSRDIEQSWLVGRFRPELLPRISSPVLTIAGVNHELAPVVNAAGAQAFALPLTAVTATGTTATLSYLVEDEELGQTVVQVDAVPIM